ncbi:hypothetical protein Tco_0843625 [Tanacetum coccineum]|uniref:Retrovirus-related Pol polyprotein from transposon TNT 1-94 n=1 Tax=Tanacetum coccineum TaxID=301880 RepID=A0ABQ5B5V1_9ASTR
MAAVNDVPQLVDKKGGMERYYLKCMKDGPFQPKTSEGDAKPESQWTPDERRVIVQDQRLKSIIMSCLPDDIMESIISCVSTKETWTDLVHSFEGPSDTKENRIMDLKLEYQTFREKSTEKLFLYPKMAAVNNVPQLVDKKGGSYAAIAPKLEPRKINRWKKHDIIESVISCETAKATWTDLLNADDALVVRQDHDRNGEWIEHHHEKGIVAVSETEPTTLLVPTEVKGTEQESKINVLTKLVQMLIDENVNSIQID